MKKIVLTICALFFVFASPVAALEWGGVLSNDTGIETPDFSDITFKQSNGVSVWFNTPLGDAFALSGEVLYKYNFVKPQNIDGIFTNIIDVPLFKFSGDIQAGDGVISLNAGRFSYADNAGAVVTTTVDGVSADFTLSVVKLGLFGAYTGLLNSLNGLVEPAGKNNKFYDFSYGYAPLGLNVEFPYLLGNQALGIQAYAILDCGDKAIKTNNYYANLALSGPISNIIYYNLASSLGFVNFKDLMNYTTFTLMLFPAEAVSVNAGVEYGSAYDGSMVMYYSPLAQKTGGKIIAKAGFTYGTDIMCLDLGFKYTIGYDSGNKKFDAATTVGSGAELNANFIYNIFSDLQAGLGFTAFFDSTQNKANKYTANLNIALAF